ncbi:MAG TPA: class I SAM-dependent methyltransferase [Gemmatimonadales bacterium]|nr:class I SAM-dependent methyltransferase [Gemmatimonadales bacterium]
MTPKAFADHFSALAPEYAAWRPHYPEALFKWLGTLAARRALAWDSGTGNGQAALGLAGVFDQVIATDASAAQLSAAAPHPRVEYRQALAEASGLDTGSVDLVTVAQALHWFDVPAFFAEAGRVLAPGGAVAIWTYGLPSFDDAPLDQALARFYSDAVGPFWAPERRHVEAGYRTLPFPFAEVATPAFEIRADWTLDALLGYVGTWSATARFREARGYNPLETFAPELLPLWGNRADARPLRWALSVRAGHLR